MAANIFRGASKMTKVYGFGNEYLVPTIAYEHAFKMRPVDNIIEITIDGISYPDATGDIIEYIHYILLGDHISYEVTQMIKESERTYPNSLPKSLGIIKWYDSHLKYCDVYDEFLGQIEGYIERDTKLILALLNKSDDRLYRMNIFRCSKLADYFRNVSNEMIDDTVRHILSSNPNLFKIPNFEAECAEVVHASRMPPINCPPYSEFTIAEVFMYGLQHVLSNNH